MTLRQLITGIQRLIFPAVPTTTWKRKDPSTVGARITLGEMNMRGELDKANKVMIEHLQEVYPDHSYYIFLQWSFYSDNVIDLAYFLPPSGQYRCAYIGNVRARNTYPRESSVPSLCRELLIAIQAQREEAYNRSINKPRR